MATAADAKRRVIPVGIRASPHCCLGLVPAVVRGVDRILYSLFAGFRCGHPCGASCGVPGCWDCHGGVELPEGIPMPEPMPPEPQMGRMYIPRSPARSPVHEEFWLGGGSVYRESAYRGTARPRPAPRPGSTAPSRSVRATSVDEPASGQLKRAEQALELLPVETPLRRVSFENLPPRESRTTPPSIPHNPLRD
ncbi:MAG: hypothetical protein KatS3mg110_0783 [Pirellulaceae bacterium]|nr:MAG: hypothetical protein KatS3mg110_0783 [Pirellulaceae bacterium]